MATRLNAIRTVLGAYRSGRGHITEHQITEAWAEHDRAQRLIEAQDRLIGLLERGGPRNQIVLARSDIEGLSAALVEGGEGR